MTLTPYGKKKLRTESVPLRKEQQPALIMTGQCKKSKSVSCRGGYRRVNLRTFPYYIAYIVHENTLWILAVAHSHRKPEYWIERKQEIR
jgi:hypothetical protein